MNPSQIESMLTMIDRNVDLTRREVIQYLKDHQQEVTQELARSGSARVKTSAGDLHLSVDDLNAAAL